MENSGSLSLAVLMALVTVPACSQSLSPLPTKKEADKILQATIQSQDLQVKGEPPFHLLAHVKYKLGGSTQEGVYELWWAAPDQFRAAFQMEKMSEVDLALRDKMYVLRNTPTLTLQFMHLRNFINHPLSHYLGSKTAAQRVYSARVGQETLNCVATQPKTNARVCLDPTTQQVVSVNIQSVSPADPYDLEQDDFVSLGARRYPRQMTWRIGAQTMEVQVKKFEEIRTFDADAFVPPAMAEVREWCPHPVLKPGYYFRTLPLPKTEPPRVFYPFYLLTGEDGHIKKFISLNPSAPSINPSVAHWIRDAQFPIWVCGARAIEHEELIINGWPGP